VSAARLDDAEWLHSDALAAVVVALSDGEARPRIVGGAVRDSLLGIEVADIDLATPLLPDDVTKRLEHAGIKAVPTGIDHGTITAVSQSKTFEITTLRRDVSTDGRRATVAFSTDWEEDAARRDFTINALYADPPTGEIFDYHHGLADLKAHHIRFIGDAAQRIAEDHLRILRLFRFHARFGRGAIDADALAAARDAASSLMALSRERIADELTKLLALPEPLGSIETMIANGIFAPFMPEIAVNAPEKLRQLINREQAVGIEPSWGRRLSALLVEDAATVDTVAARLKLSNKARTDLGARLSELSPDSNNARAIAYRLGLGLARDIILLRATDWQAAWQKLDGWEVPQLLIKGGELVAKGLNAGPLVARTLAAIERQWISEDFPDATRARAIADQAVADALLATKNS
jgi:poly(A) polymerase